MSLVFCEKGRIKFTIPQETTFDRNLRSDFFTIVTSGNLQAEFGNIKFMDTLFLLIDSY